MTTRSPSKQTPTCLWTTPRSLLVGVGLVEVTFLSSVGGCGQQEKGVQQPPGEPRHLWVQSPYT